MKNRFIGPALLALLTVLVLCPSSLQAAPADPFVGATPSFDTPAGEVTNHNLGDWGVAEQRGAATYTFPLDVPSGRNGMAPALALRYSSQAPLRGGLAVGWTLEVPSIQLDQSRGNVAQPIYQASLGQASGRLVEVPDANPFSGKSYRAEFDPTFTRFFNLTPDQPLTTWVALTNDGVKHYFGNESFAGDGVMYWPLTRQVDSFGNTVRYFWDRVTLGSYVGYSLQRIEYTSNDQARLAAHAKLEFTYTTDTCPNSNIPIGARLVAGKTLLLEGTQRLTSVRVSVRETPGADWRLHERLDLSYAVGSCEANPSPNPSIHDTEAPLRYLTRIDTVAFDPAGTPTRLPPITFGYNLRASALRPTRTVANPGFGHQGTILGPTTNLVDLDSDGIPDRISVIEENGICTLVWQQGLRGGGYADNVRKTALPTVAWLDDNPRPGNGESCQLSGQMAFRRRQIVGGSTAIEKGVLGYHFMDFTSDGRIDLVTSVWAAMDHNTYVPDEGLGANITSTDDATQIDTTDIVPVAVATPDPSNPNLVPLTPEGATGAYPIRIYRNASDPQSITPGSVADPIFSSISFKALLPKPALPPTVGGVTVNPNSWHPTSISNLTDIDGDGFLDFVEPGETSLLGVDQEDWSVYFGTGEATFGPKTVWSVPQVNLAVNGNGRHTEANGIEHLTTAILAQLLDLNGDGRPDLVAQTNDQALKVFWNTGAQFRETPVSLGLNNPLEITQADYTEIQGDVVLSGAMGYRRRMQDVNQDGLVDLLIFGGSDTDITQTDQVQVLYNVGDRFVRGITNPDWIDAKRLFLANEGAWHLVGDLVDGNADGLPEFVHWSPDGTEKIMTTALFSPAPRLLRSVDNGRGLQVIFKYAVSTDSNVVRWQQIGNKGSDLPSPVWVVSEVDVQGGFGSPQIVTRYTYDEPALLSADSYRPNHEPDYFHGFRQVTTDSYNGNSLLRQVRHTYSYDEGLPDGSLIDERIYETEGDTLRLNEIRTMRWQRKPLFDGQLLFAHQSEVETRICPLGSNESDCVTQTNTLRQKRESWTPVGDVAADTCVGVSNTPVTRPRLYLKTQGDEVGTTMGGRQFHRLNTCYQVRYGQPGFAAEDYRTLAVESQEEEALTTGNDPQYVQRGRSLTHYDPATGLPLQTDNWVDPNTIATTKRTFDPATGNLLTLSRAEQNKPGSDGKRIAHTYDPHQLFVRTTTNELGHQTTMIHDIATGVVLERRGPNAITLESGEVVLERETWQTDGFGRVLAHAVSFDDAAGQYTLHTISKTSYFDQEQPNRMRREQRRDLDNDVWITVETRLDGLGRVLDNTQFLADGQTAVTSFTYDGDGNRIATHVPDPRTDDGSRVRYTYRYDGLGRLTQFRRPDDTGISVTYAGLAKTIQEVTGDGSGAAKKELYDIFGRLIEVHELDPAASAAISRYHCDGDDNLVLIIDAEGNETHLEHDWLGRRLAVRRGDRIWRYDYDLNGNIIQRIAPFPTQEGPARYITSYQYDELDRVTQFSFADQQITSLTPPPDSEGIHLIYLPLIIRSDSGAASGPAPSSPLAAQVEATTTTLLYRYDEGRNGIGRLSSVQLPFAQVAYGYEARGLVTNEERSFTLTDIAQAGATQRVVRQYNAQGQLVRSVWDDGQAWRIAYDARGLVDTVEWLDPQTGLFQAVADFERSLAGAPRTRGSNFDQIRSYDYDVLGRPAQEAVTVKGNALATRSYTYNDSGDLIGVSGATAGLSADATYSYDAQHRLTGAIGPNGYRGDFTYSPTGNILTASVTWNESTETRQVRYEYGAVDPQAVDRLIDLADGSPYAEFDYDPAGTMVDRRTPNGDTAMLWDGQDRLRLVDGPNGVEVYFYDHAGMRLLAVSQSEGVRFWFGESETHFALDGSQTRRYLHLSAGGAALARVEDKSKIELQYADALQNLMFALDSAGNMLADFLYGPFGEVVRASGDADHRRQFNGKENDAVSGLRYYGYRYYDPLLLRWNSADPLYRFLPDLGLGAPQRMNLYGFSLNNPVRYYDPDGRDAVHNPPPGPFGDQSPIEGKSPFEHFGCYVGSQWAAGCVNQHEDEGEIGKGQGEIGGDIIGVDATKDGKFARSKPSVGVSIAGKLSLEGRSELSDDVAVSAELTALGAEASAKCDGEGCKAGFNIDLGTVEGCAEVCTPIPFTDYDVCGEVCVGVGLSVGAEAEIGGGKAGAGANIGLVKVKTAVSVRRRKDVFLFQQLLMDMIDTDDVAMPPRMVPFGGAVFANESPRLDR